MSLIAILNRMGKLGATVDIEAGHADADDLLIETLRELAPNNPIVEDVIAAYNDVPKWYA